jgi:hypothetical protein
VGEPDDKPRRDAGACGRLVGDEPRVGELAQPLRDRVEPRQVGRAAHEAEQQRPPFRRRPVVDDAHAVARLPDRAHRRDQVAVLGEARADRRAEKRLELRDELHVPALSREPDS